MVVLAVSVTEVTEQLRFAGAGIVTDGVVIFCRAVVQAVVVQPFAGSVIVTQYDPGTVTVLVAVVMPPVQL
jgi:hypothetical protein